MGFLKLVCKYSCFNYQYVFMFVHYHFLTRFPVELQPLSTHTHIYTLVHTGAHCLKHFRQLLVRISPCSAPNWFVSFVYLGHCCCCCCYYYYYLSFLTSTDFYRFCYDWRFDLHCLCTFSSVRCLLWYLCKVARKHENVSVREYSGVN